MKQAHVSEKKKTIVKDFTKLISEHAIIGVVNMENLPAKQLQKMRSTLRGSVLLRMTKRNLLKLAIDNNKNKKGIEKLNEHLGGMPALLFTDTNPFELFKVLKQNKSKAPIKAGQKAPYDIIVPAGPTGFSPGPIIGELGQVGIAAGIEGGKVSVKKDSLVAKKGEAINDKQASVFMRLGIEPMEIGLDLVAVYENGEMLTKEVLDINMEEYLGKIFLAHRQAMSLAIEMAYPAEETSKLLLSAAFRQARAVAISNNIIADAIIPDLLWKAYAEAMALTEQAAPAETQAEPAKKEEKQEEKKEESVGLGGLFGG